MGLSLGSNVISTNNEYGFKANVLQELEQAQNARIQALQAASDAQASALNSSQNATICTNAMENAQTYMIAAQSFMTSANESATNEVNAVISSAPGFVLNHLEDGLPIALSGKVPVRIIGKVNKFDKIVLSNIPGIGRVKQNNEQVIAIALEENHNEDEKLVMCVTKLSF